MYDLYIKVFSFFAQKLLSSKNCVKAHYDINFLEEILANK